MKRTPPALSRHLLELKPNEEGQIHGFSEDLPAEYTSRLRELGFREGEFVRCLRRPPMGAPRIFEIGGTVFSIEASLAGQIQLVRFDLPEAHIESA